RRGGEEKTPLAGKGDGLEGLESERVGLPPAAARLPRDRAPFGGGGGGGPPPAFLGAGPAPPPPVARYPRPPGPARLGRDGAVAAGSRRWHANTNPGALLLLPLDAPALRDAAGPDALGALVRSEGAGGAWVRALLGQVRSLDDGAAFVDGRGAVWLPGS